MDRDGDRRYRHRSGLRARDEQRNLPPLIPGPSLVTSSRLRKELARAQASTLILRARELAAGWAAGAHRAERKGSGVEFAGHRGYTPGDDLRHLDRHALLRHGRLLIREFLSDTERSVHLLVDATPSMLYRGSLGASKPSKAELSLLLAAALGFIGQSNGDRIGLTTITQDEVFSVKPRGGREAFERVLHQLEKLDDDLKDPPPVAKSKEQPGINWNQVFSSLGVSLPRGTLILAFSDFLDIAREEQRALAALSTRRRALRAVQVLTRDEVEFPFEGSVRLRDVETGLEVETEASSVRREYRAALSELTANLKSETTRQGGQFLRILTEDSVDVSLRSLASGIFTDGRSSS